MAEPGGSRAADDEAGIARAARDLAYDDYLAALLAPAAARADLLTLAAYFGEIARVPLQVSEAALGEIRLQWWRDALSSDGRSGHPVADALNALKFRAGLPLDLLLAPLEARAAELYAEPFPDAAAFDATVDASEAAHLRLRAHVLEPGRDAAFEALIAEAARVLGLTRWAVRLPFLLAKGRYPLDAQRLAMAAPGAAAEVDEAALRAAVRAIVGEAEAGFRRLRPRLRRMTRAQRQVVLPVALAGPYLRVLQGVGHDLLRDVAEPSPLTRSARLWGAARLGWF